MNAVFVNTKKDVKARAKLLLLLDPFNYIYPSDTETILEKLLTTPAGLTQRLRLLRELITTSFENWMSIEQGLLEQNHDFSA